MQNSALQSYIFTSKYARYLPEKKRRETWEEAVGRVEDMHLRRYPQVKSEINWAFDLYRQQKVLGSQRVLQYGGSPVEKNHTRVYNCWFSYCDRVRFFQELFFILLSGGGTGFSVQRHHVAKLPSVAACQDRPVFEFVIPDTIEGWADSAGVLIRSFLDEESIYFRRPIDFNPILVRPKGSPISSGGKAPGPGPLLEALGFVKSILISRAGKFLRPLDCYDICMHFSDAVLAGGVRRSASLAQFSPDDMEMATAKTGDWLSKHPQRQRSNNSALLVRGKTSREQFGKLMACTRQFGEPGFIWAEDEEAGYNPCVEIGLLAYDRMMRSGWQPCNVATTNGLLIKCRKDFTEAARAAAIIGTLQAGYTTFDYLGPVTEEIARREALLGVSITGIMENPSVLLNPEFQREAAAEVLKANAEIAKKIGINLSARSTCVKPEGTASAMLGTSSGIHPHHARRYFRRVQGNDNENPLVHLQETNPESVESNGFKRSILFQVEATPSAILRDELSAVEFLSYVKLTQENWVEGGKRKELCVEPWLSHNVSNTVTVKEHEWEETTDFIYDNRHSFAGISLLSDYGELDFPKAPMLRVWTEREMVDRYGAGALLASGLIVDALHVFDDDLWAACEAVQAFTVGNKAVFEGDKLDWIKRAIKFAKNFFEGDINKTLYCLKEVSNFHRWNRLEKLWKDVDYTQMIEEEDQTSPQAEAACAGPNGCEVR